MRMTKLRRVLWGIGGAFVLAGVVGVLADGGTKLYDSGNDKGMELNLMPSELDAFPLDGPVKLDGVGRLGVMTGGFDLDGCGTNVVLVSGAELAQGVVVKDLNAAGVAAVGLSARAVRAAGGVAQSDYEAPVCDTPMNPTKPKPLEPQPEIAAVLGKLGVNALLVLRETGTMSYGEKCTLLGGCNAASSSAGLAATMFARDGHVLWSGGGFADGELGRPNPMTWVLGIAPSVDTARKGAAEMMVRDLLADTRK